MKANCVKALAFLASLSFTSASLAITISTASWHASGGVTDAVGPGSQSKQLSGGDLRQEFGGKGATVSGEADAMINAKGSASISVTAYARAVLGNHDSGPILAARVTAFPRVSVSNAAILMEGGNATLGELRAFADFRDVATLAAPGHENRVLDGTAHLYLTGDMGVDITGTPKFLPPPNHTAEEQANFARVSVRALVSANLGRPPGSSFPTQFASKDQALGYDVIKLQSPPHIEFPVYARVGAATEFLVSLEVIASAKLFTLSTGLGADTVSAFINGDFSHTLRWGGITDFVDAETGEPIENWTITSESGFDYAHGVPEPWSILIISQAVCAWCFVRRRREQRCDRG